jgi:hypothetical protein
VEIYLVLLVVKFSAYVESNFLTQSLTFTVTVKEVRRNPYHINLCENRVFCRIFIQSAEAKMEAILYENMTPCNHSD